MKLDLNCGKLGDFRLKMWLFYAIIKEIHMIIVGLSLGAFLSLTSLGLLLFLQAPEGGKAVILLFFVSFFLASASLSALFGMTFLRSFSYFSRSELVWVRRGVLIGLLSTLILLLSVFDVLNLAMVFLVVTPFAFIETYFVKLHGKPA